MLIHTQENNLALPEKLHFHVKLKPMSFLNKADDRVDIPDHSVLVRTDTEQPLSIVGNRYEPTQFHDIIEKQTEGLEKSGLLKNSNFICKDFLYDGGRRFKREVIMKDLTIEPKVGDLVQFTQTAKSSHNGSLCNISDSTPKRLACDNGMLQAIWQLVFAFRHTAGFDVENLVSIFNSSTEKFFEMEPYFKSMTKTKMSISDVERLLKKTICKRKATKKKNIDHKEKLFSWLLAQYKKEAVNLDDTVWAFYNALTNWATHPELYDYKEDSKFYNIEESNKNQVLLFFQSPAWTHFYDGNTSAW